MGRDFVTDGDFMEIGDTGLVPIEGGKFLDLETEEIVEPDDDEDNTEDTATEDD